MTTKPTPLPRLFIRLAYHVLRAILAFLLISAIVLLLPFIFAIR